MARLDAGLTISELAQRARVSRDTISHAERGQHSLQAPTLSKIARVLGRTPSELLAEEERLSPKAAAPSSDTEPTLEEALAEQEEEWRAAADDPDRAKIHARRSLLEGRNELFREVGEADFTALLDRLGLSEDFAAEFSLENSPFERRKFLIANRLDRQETLLEFKRSGVLDVLNRVLEGASKDPANVGLRAEVIRFCQAFIERGAYFAADDLEDARDDARQLQREVEDRALQSGVSPATRRRPREATVADIREALRKRKARAGSPPQMAGRQDSDTA